MDEVLPKDHVADTSTRIIGALGVIFQDQLDQQAAAAGTNGTSTAGWLPGLFAATSAHPPTLWAPRTRFNLALEQWHRLTPVNNDNGATHHHPSGW